MKTIFSLFILLISFSSTTYAGELFINDSNYKYLAKGKTLIVFFGTDWCMYSKKFSPVFKKTARELNHFNFARIDSDKNKKAAVYFGASSVPYIAAYKNGRFYKQYRGSRSYVSFLDWSKRIFDIKSKDKNASASDKMIKFVSDNLFEWEVYFPDTKKSAKAIVLELSENSIVYIFTMKFGSREYGFTNVWRKNGDSWWSYAKDTSDRGDNKLVKKINNGLYKFSGNKLRKHGQNMWNTNYLINKRYSIDKSKLK